MAKVPWLACLLWVGCTAKVDESANTAADDSTKTGTDDTDDSTVLDDSGKKSGFRWAGEYTGTWSLVFDAFDESEPAGTCSGSLDFTMVDESDMTFDVGTNNCDGIASSKKGGYGSSSTSTITKPVITLAPESPTNGGSGQWTTSGGSASPCSFEFDWIWSDIHDPTTVTAEYTLATQDANKPWFCLDTGYTLNIEAALPMD